MNTIDRIVVFLIIELSSYFTILLFGRIDSYIHIFLFLLVTESVLFIDSSLIISTKLSLSSTILSELTSKFDVKFSAELVGVLSPKLSLLGFITDLR